MGAICLKEAIIEIVPLCVAPQYRLVPRKGFEPPLPLREADFKFTAGCSPMSSTVRSGTHSLAVNRVPRQWRYSKDNYGL